jgi:hypothetical protein
MIQEFEKNSLKNFHDIHERFLGLELNLRGDMVYNKNIVLIFLIIMLSFAIVSEVSAVEIDDAEPPESGLNGPHRLFNPAGPQMPSERFHEASNGSVGYTINNHNSNINRTSLSDVPSGTAEHKNLYEYDNHENSHDLDGQKNTDFPIKEKSHNINSSEDFVENNMDHGEKMKDAPKQDFDRTMPRELVENQFSEGIDEITSELIGMESASVAFKNLRRDAFDSPSEFNGVLPQELPKGIVFEYTFSLTDEFGGLDSIGGDLSYKNITPDFLTLIDDISLSDTELPIVDDATPENSQLNNNFLLEITNINRLKNTHFQFTHNSMPIGNSIHDGGFDNPLKHGSDCTPNLEEEFKI